MHVNLNLEIVLISSFIVRGFVFWQSDIFIPMRICLVSVSGLQLTLSPTSYRLPKNGARICFRTRDNEAENHSYEKDKR